MSKSDGTVEIEYKLVRKTDRARLINNGKVEVWIPESQITDEATDGTTIFIPEWLAIEKGLV